ncbi:MAG: thymidylate kinase [Pseudonocardia sp.]|nr:thymidylate kinase [Pseudonocardia sp.]
MECRYPFIVIEGLDGAGKTTLRKALFHLWDGLYRVTPLCVLTTNFLDAAVAADIVDGKYLPTPDNRERYLAALVADKSATMRQVIEPALPTRPVIADRWLLSELAFFAVKHGVSPQQTYRALTATAGRWADITFVLDLPAEASLLRAQSRAGDATRADWDTLDVQGRVRATYQAVVTSPGDFPALGAVVRLDAASGQASVLHQAWTALREHGLMPATVTGART